jgi:serine/threonine-protein kinase
MEYVEGFDLRDLLRECSKKRLPLPIQYALLLVTEVLGGLDYAHKKVDDDGTSLSIVHRDVSPSNVLISFEGDVKLCDFGIALALGADGSLPEAGVQGKAGYMSPEAASGKGVDGRSDVFAVGIILWELLNGRRLYKGENKSPPTIHQAAEGKIPPLKKRGYAREEELHAIVMRALAKDPAERWTTAGEMKAALQGYIRESGLFSSPLKFGHWLTEHFAEEILQRRRSREVAAKAIAQGPLLQVTPSPGAAEALAGRGDKASQATKSAGGSSVPGVADSIALPDSGGLSVVKRGGQPGLVLAIAALAVVVLVVLLSL